MELSSYLTVANTLLLASPLVFLLLWRFTGRLLRLYFLRKYTTVDGLPLLGVTRDKKIQGTAVVCGGSISGILTARVCSDHFTNVIIIDPELTEVVRSKPSTRIAQYDSLHGYLTFVLEGMRRLWPNFDAELRKAGGFIASGDVKPFFGGTLMPAPHDEYARKAQALPETMFARRPVLENVLRGLLLGGKRRANVHTVAGSVRALELAHTGGGTRVAAVVVRQADGGEITINEPALVADCSGDSQAGLKWLRRAGVDVPPALRLEYDQRLHYVTVTFALTEETKMRVDAALRAGGEPPLDSTGWLYTFVPHYNVCNEGFVLGRMDNDTMQLCCGGWGDVALPRAPGEIEGYVASARGREPIPEWLLEVVRILAEDGAPHFKPLKIRPCSYIRYQDAPGLPANFVAVGDAMLQLNPIYAQGCSKAMMGVVTLNALLAGSEPAKDFPVDFGHRYFREVGGHGEALWESTKTFDYGFASTRPVKGETLDCGSFARWYLDLFIDAALKDSELASCMWHVRMLLAPPTDMFAPGILWRLASRTLQSRITHTTS
ncbi:hypothetical protein PsYK624_102880 [Phanerochaete sordida]|uniref:FAD/NAD(P)-binding domain-containing protein n=1 Tax=Phanerochaete sordida TaxID=48140 RepID=A0A9P3LGA6_9APHY|nr:hypothetical protein PsYK624_102880 [Phanerochaete sordida]